MNQKQSSGSWVPVIILLIVFWPVGLFMLFSKLSKDKGAVFSGAKGLNVVAWILIGFGIIGIFVYVTMSPDDPNAANRISGIAVSLAIAAGGGAVLGKARRMKIDSAKYRKYINVIINEERTDIGEIASATGIPYAVVKTDLQAMIDKGYFPGAYVHETDGKFVMPSASQTDAASSQMETEVRICAGCGANNTVPVGRQGVCEYCGSGV
jgi:hypothetical protein